MTASALYEGWVRHRRHTPVEHSFKYRHSMVLLDLDELPGILDRHPLFSARRPALARFRREDHIGDPDLPLAGCVRGLVAERTGTRPEGPIRLLTTLRTMGHNFNPVSFFYCFAPADDGVEAVVAQVTNTPWGERHAYVLARRGETVMRDTMDKAFHVSPFIGMDNRYDWRVTEPNGQLLVHVGRAPPTTPTGPMRNELARHFMFRAFGGITNERLVVEEDGRRHVFGPPEGVPHAQVTVHSPDVWRRVMRGSTGLAESYVDGLWETDDLVGLIRVAARNMHALDRARRRWHPVLRAGQQIAGMVPHNDREGSRRNISAHYDLGNQLFSLFLDPTMMYSCALFESPDVTLEQAQQSSSESASSCGSGRTTTCSRSVRAGARWQCTRPRATAAASPPPSRRNSTGWRPSA